MTVNNATITISKDTLSTMGYMLLSADATLDLLGESVTSLDKSDAATRDYLAMIEAMPETAPKSIVALPSGSDPARGASGVLEASTCASPAR